MLSRRSALARRRRSCSGSIRTMACSGGSTIRRRRCCRTCRTIRRSATCSCWPTCAARRSAAPIPAEQFALEIPAGAKRMKSFVVPPPPLPSNLFGKQPPDFFVRRLATAGGPRPRSWAGKIAVLVWYHDDPACKATLQQVSLAKRAAEGGSRALASGRRDRSDDEAPTTNSRGGWPSGRSSCRSSATWRLSATRRFRLQVQPTIVVLDQQGRVQSFSPAATRSSPSSLCTIVQRLKRGDDPAAELLARQAARAKAIRAARRQRRAASRAARRACPRR